MMSKTRIHKLLTICISTVWLANGLFCKVLNWVPRHQLIVEKILGTDYSRALTILIGVSEVLMAIWILSSYKTKINAITQITIVALMNTLEFFLVPELLLWGKLNSLYAMLFVLVVYFNEFHLNQNSNT